MFTGKDKAEVDVHDVVQIKSDCSVEVRRTYTFTNDTASAITVSWQGEDRIPTQTCSVTVTGNCSTFLGVTGGSAQVARWTIRDLAVAAQDHAKVSLVINASAVAVLQPFSCCYQFETRNRCHYSLEVHPPHAQLFQDGATQAAVETSRGESTGLVVDAAGVLRTTKSLLVSSNRTGMLSVSIRRQMPVVPMTRLMTVYANRGAGGDKPLSGHVVILIPHLLRDSLSYVKAMLALGLNPEFTFIVGIPYSTKPSAVSALWEMGIRNIATPHAYPFDETVRETLVAAIEAAKSSRQKLLVIEDGGYIGPLVHKNFPEVLPLFTGIVEQTANGIWQYSEQKIDLKLPVMNVAESVLKKDRESPLIGKAVVHNIDVLLRVRGWGLDRYKPLVIGYGATGSRVAQALRKQGVEPVVFDEVRERRERVVSDGFSTGEVLKDLIRGRNLIIGCTGKTALNMAELTAAEHGAVFANASSKRREINYDDLKTISKNRDWKKLGWAAEIELITGRSLYLLADGYPVNFVGESVEDEEISFIYSLLIESGLYLLGATGVAPGLVVVPDDIQQRIAALHDSLNTPN